MHLSPRFLSLLACAALLLKLVPGLPAQSPEATVTAPATPATPESPPPPAADTPAASAEVPPTTTIESPESPAAAEPEAQSAAAESASATEQSDMAANEEPAPEEKPATPAHKVKQRHQHKGVERVTPFGEARVLASEVVDTAVSILGSTVVDGKVLDEAVAVLGNNSINGSTGGEAVAILGNLEIQGEVGRDAVAVLGDVILGPRAVVHGKVVAVLGKVIRAEGSTSGDVQEIGMPAGLPKLVGIHNWFTACALKLRPLALDYNVLWAWGVAGIHLLVYLLIALISGKGVSRCVDTLRERPGMSLVSTFLSFFLGALLLPLITILLAITGVGAILIPFLFLCLFFAGLYARTLMHAWLGGLFTRIGRSGTPAPVVLDVLVGGVVISLLYCVPVLGLLLHGLLGLIGMGVLVYTLVLGFRSRRAATPPAPQPPAAAAPLAATAPAVLQLRSLESEVAVPPLPVSEPPAAPLSETPPLVTPLVATPAPVASATTASPGAGIRPPTSDLPRATFMLRMGALFIDTMLVVLACALASSILPGVQMGPWFLIVLAIYGACLWKTRGTTIGGIILKIEVVRLDDRPLDWTTCWIRALGSILSAFAGGLGFLWIAFDRDSESWHDKIAGTAVVRVEKSRPLV